MSTHKIQLNNYICIGCKSGTQTGVQNVAIVDCRKSVQPCVQNEATVDDRNYCLYESHKECSKY